MEKLNLVNELHRDARKNFVRRSTQMRGINDTLQADLVEIIPYASENKNMKYILTVINIFSKKAFARPLRNKTGAEVTKAMKSILDSINHPIKNLHVDMGKEFYNKSMDSLLRQAKIKRYSTYTTKKAAIVERFNRTLKGRMWKSFSFCGKYKWIDKLQNLITEYNNTRHRTIKMAPNKVTHQNEQMLLDTVYNYVWNLGVKFKPKFKVGDFVRLSKYKHIFEKSYTPNWTTEIFKVRKIQHTNPITYLLVDLNEQPIEGTVYQEELQIVQQKDIYLVEKILSRKKDMVYVKWLGFADSHNSWINKKEVL